MIRLFKKKEEPKRWTMWFPLGTFIYDRVNYVTLMRKDINSGMLEFQTKPINSRKGTRWDLVNPLPVQGIIDTTKVWNFVTGLTITTKDYQIPINDDTTS